MTRENAILCLKGIKNYARDTFTEQSDWQESLDMAIEALEVEPKHGRWISTASTLTGYWHKCSGCGGVAIPYYNGQDILSPYCPWCGARMDEVEE